MQLNSIKQLGHAYFILFKMNSHKTWTHELLRMQKTLGIRTYNRPCQRETKLSEYPSINEATSTSLCCFKHKNYTTTKICTQFLPAFLESLQNASTSIYYLTFALNLEWKDNGLVTLNPMTCVQLVLPMVEECGERREIQTQSCKQRKKIHEFK